MTEWFRAPRATLKCKGARDAYAVQGWSGTVTSIDEDGTVYLATNQFPTNVQFDLSKEVTSGLREGERVRFVGTVEKVLDAETAPPMFHTYVVLRDVELEKSEK